MTEGPFYAYIYTSEGKHYGGVELPRADDVRAFLRGAAPPAIERGVEVIITDRGDYTVFHAKEGVVLWPVGLKEVEG